MALLDEMADREGVLGGIARCEALVRHVEEGEQLLLLELGVSKRSICVEVSVTRLDDVGQLNPLLLGRVDASWVVRTCVKEDNALLGCVLEASLAKHGRNGEHRATLRSSVKPAQSRPTVSLSK